MATSWMKAHHWIYQLQLFTGLLNTLGKINQSNASLEQNVDRTIHWRKDNDLVRIWGREGLPKKRPRENLLEMNVALVNLWEISEPWPGGIQGGQPEGLS